MKTIARRPRRIKSCGFEDGSAETLYLRRLAELLLAAREAFDLLGMAVVPRDVLWAGRMKCRFEETWRKVDQGGYWGNTGKFEHPAPVEPEMKFGWVKARRVLRIHVG